MKRLVMALSLAAILSGGANAAEQQVIAVWPGTAPGSESWSWNEESNATDANKASLNYRNVVAPAITVWPADKPNGTAMLVIPGGGFRNVVTGKEGDEIANWLNSIGVTAFVLKYRVARTGDEDAQNPAKLNARIAAVVPLAVNDADEAVKIIRRRGAEWGVKKLGVIGFSAGGLLTVATATTMSAPERPDFVVPVYAAAPQEMKVTADSPPCFLVLAENDRYGTGSSIAIYQAWHAAKAPVELHLYLKGDHGFALRKTGTPTDTWADRLVDWMKLLGLLPVN